MKLIVVLAALVAAALADDVVTLTTDNFESTIAENDYVLVEFFAPWCGHCKRLAPEYAKAATALKEDGIVLGAVDATVDKDLASKFEVRGYPTLKLFKKGVATEYKGGRTEDTIISYMRKATGPPAKELAGADDVTKFAEGNKVAVVGFFAELSGAEYDAFIKAAEADEKYTYGVTTDSAAAEAAGASAPGVVLFKQFDEPKVVFDGDFAKDLADFVTANSIPSVIPFTMEVAGDIFQSSIGKVAMLFTENEVAEYTDLAKANKGKFVFATSDSSQTRLTGYIGVEKADFPVFYIITTGGQMKKFPLAGEPTADAIQAHLDAFLSGDLKPTYKSEPVPENNDGPVTVIVGKNFDDIVMDESKDVLLEIYAPWCGHCKKLEPIYNDLGEHYASNKNIVIAKMDGTANEVDGIDVRGFPTLKFFPAGSKNRGGQDYKGGRELDDFKKFMDENSKHTDSHDEL
jgi:protein disulfide-isomerase A1